jgi:hypothetical protein
MGQIVVEGTTFNIKGDQPTEAENKVISDYLIKDVKQTEDKSGKNQAVDDIETVLQKGISTQDEDTDSYLQSPAFGRLVTEVLLSIGGSVAAAYVPGGQVALPLMLARVAKYSRPLITAAKTAIGAGIGGGTGAAISQTFDPKEDIIKEITRAAGEGAIGDVAGRGISKVLGGIYSKVVGKSTSTINEARVAEKLLSKEKKSIEEAIKAKSSGQTLDDFTEKRLARLQDELGPDYAQRISQAVITPSLVNKNFLLNVLENVTEGSFTGGGRIIRAREATLGALRSGLDDLIERATVVGKTQIPNEDVMGALFKEAVTEQDTLFRAASKAKYQEVDTILKNTIGDANVIDTRPLKALAKTQIKKLMKQGTLKNDEAIKTYQRAFNLGNKVSYGDMHEFNKTINALARNIDDSVPFRSKEAKILMKDAVDELTLGKTMGNQSAFKKIFGENYTFPVNNSLKKIPTELRDQIINANTFYKTGMKNFNDELLVKMMQKNPEDVYKFIVAGGKGRTTTAAIFDRVDKIFGKGTKQYDAVAAEKTKDVVRAQYYNDMLGKAKGGDYSTGSADASKMQKFLRNTEETRKILFGKEAGKIGNRLEAYKDALAVAQGKFEAGGLPGKMFVQLKQAAAIGQLPAALTTGYFGDPGSAMTILLAPALLSRVFTNPALANLLIKGAKGQSFEQTGRVFGQILSRLRADGEITKEEEQEYKEQFKSFKTPPEKKQEIPDEEETVQVAESTPIQPTPVNVANVTQTEAPATTPAQPSPVNTQVTDPMQYASLFPQDALGQAIAQRKVI